MDVCLGVLSLIRIILVSPSQFWIQTGIAFGDVSNRDQTIVSSQEVYRRLLLRTPDRDVLSFDVLALAALRSNGTLSQEKLKSLIKLLRPDRDGKVYSRRQSSFALARQHPYSRLVFVNRKSPAFGLCEECRRCLQGSKVVASVYQKQRED